METTLTDTKTGAIICLRPLPGNQEHEYVAKLFITDIPYEITDEELKVMLDKKKMSADFVDCAEIIIRADINATANEVWEQFKGLSGGENDAGIISFKELF